MSERLLRLPEVISRVGLKRSALYERVQHGDFPRPLKLGRASAWIESEVDRYVADRIQEARGPDASRPAKPESTGGDGSHPQGASRED